jgi:hypothetical protein
MAHEECPLEGNAPEHQQLSPLELDEQALIFKQEIDKQYKKQAEKRAKQAEEQAEQAKEQAEQEIINARAAVLSVYEKLMSGKNTIQRYKKSISQYTKDIQKYEESISRDAEIHPPPRNLEDYSDIIWFYQECIRETEQELEKIIAEVEKLEIELNAAKAYRDSLLSLFKNK